MTTKTRRPPTEPGDTFDSLTVLERAEPYVQPNNGTCRSCSTALPSDSTPRRIYCPGNVCRSSAWRARRQSPTKVCSSCKVQKATTDYQRRAASHDGLQSRCRECTNGAMSRHYGSNRSRLIVDRAAWRATSEGREAVWAQGAVSRARRFGAPVVERVHRLDVFTRDGWLCTLCAEPMRHETGQHPMSATVDHTVPLAEGGSHVLDNCRSAHRMCNRSKSDDPLLQHWQRTWTKAEGKPMPLGRAVLWHVLTPGP